MPEHLPQHITSDLRLRQQASMPLPQSLRVHVLHQRRHVGAVEVDARAQLLPHERLEDGEQHVEDVRLVDDVDRLHANRHGFLEV